MTEDEWDGVALLMEDCWAGDFDDGKAHSYRVFLDRFSPQEVIAALHRLAETGKPFLPKVPEIVQSIRRNTELQVPSWPEVWSALQRALKERAEDKAIAYLDGIHPLLGAFLRLEGWKELRLVPFYDEEWGFKRIDELHGRWDDFVRVQQERGTTARALAAVGGGQPHQLDPLAVLGLDPPKPKQLGAG